MFFRFDSDLSRVLRTLGKSEPQTRDVKKTICTNLISQFPNFLFTADVLIGFQCILLAVGFQSEPALWHW